MSGRPLVSTFFTILSLKAISLIDNTISDIAYKRNIRSRETDMTKTYTNEIGQQINVVVVKEYAGVEPMYLVHKEGATSTKYVFGVPARKCKPKG
jgi:hypothetical protein